MYALFYFFIATYIYFVSNIDIINNIKILFISILCFYNNYLYILLDNFIANHPPVFMLIYIIVCIYAIKK